MKNEPSIFLILAWWSNVAYTAVVSLGSEIPWINVYFIPLGVAIIWYIQFGTFGDGSDDTTYSR